MKVQATHYKGIEFVSFQELPTDQQLLLQHNTRLERINILINGKIYRDCIQYKTYSAWFESVFIKSRQSPGKYSASVPASTAIEA